MKNEILRTSDEIINPGQKLEKSVPHFMPIQLRYALALMMCLVGHGNHSPHSTDNPHHERTTGVLGVPHQEMEPTTEIFMGWCTESAMAHFEEFLALEGDQQIRKLYINYKDAILRLAVEKFMKDRSENNVNNKSVKKMPLLNHGAMKDCVHLELQNVKKELTKNKKD